jgi:Thiol:disulfide interchange protein DsbD, N-terminal
MNRAETPPNRTRRPHAGARSVVRFAEQLIFWAFLAVAAFWSTAHAVEEHVSISATSEFTQIHPDGTGILAITLTIDDGWHVYWPGVSDSGYGLSLDIDAPVSITLDEPIWPTPKRYLQPGDILDMVYEDTATILVPFHLNASAQPDAILAFEINAGFLVCDEICLPGTATTTTTLTIVEPSTKPTPTPSASQIRKDYDARPIVFDPHSDAVRLQWITDRSAIMFRDATKIEFFPSKDCTELADPIAGTLAEGNRLIIKFTQRTNKILAGRVRVYERRRIVDYDIAVHAPDS